MQQQRLVLTPSTEQPLPMFIESIGHQAEQERIAREEGYPSFHWIQTIEGEGYITFEGKTYELPTGTGVLLMPNTAHSYQPLNEHWSTDYLTFDGPIMQEMLLLLGLNKSGFFRFGVNTPLQTNIQSILRRMKTNPDFSGMFASGELYSFLMTLKRYGQATNKLPLSDTILKLQPLLDWLDHSYNNPGIGLTEMAQQLRITPRYLNTLFRRTFGHSPYAYLIALRIRKSKELLLRSPKLSINLITSAVGFRDPSHFVATFRDYVGYTPEKFRELN
jgi:AraC family transcriptional regulator of arabinose operon